MDLINDQYILAWWLSSNNFGDNLNHFLIKQLSGKTPVYAINRAKPHYLCCGSILGEYTDASMVWGAGFYYDHQSLLHDIPVYAVRGELTRGQIKKDVQVGDPAMLLPLLYNPTVQKKHSSGIIPHWSNIQKVFNTHSHYHIIDPMQSVKDFVDDVLSCEMVFSESLHGLIVADAYKIPNRWINLGTDIGDGYKYRDYYTTVTNPEEQPSPTVYIKEAKVHTYKYDIQSFLNSCPFYNGLN